MLACSHQEDLSLLPLYPVILVASSYPKSKYSMMRVRNSPLLDLKQSLTRYVCHEDSQSRGNGFSIFCGLDLQFNPQSFLDVDSFDHHH